MLGKAPQINVQDRVLNQIQDNIVSKLNQLLGLELLQGHFLNGIHLVAGDNIINHMLGRELLGWFVTRQNSEASLYDNQDSNDSTTTTLIINSTQDATVNLYVF